MSKKKSSQRLKREVVRVEGQVPGIRSAEERTAMKSRVERYILGNIILKRLLENRLLTKSEFKTLDKRNVQQSGLWENSSIVEKSNHYARANTSLTQKRVNRFVSGALNILRSFCDKQLPKELRHLSTRIADDVTSSMTIQHAEQTEHIESVIHAAVREAVQASPLSPEKGLEYAKSGQLNTIGEHMTDYFHTISSQHILFPHYGYGPQHKGQKINVVSVPMTEEAKRIYPPHFKCNGTLTIEGRTVPYPTPELFQFGLAESQHIFLIKIIILLF